MRMSTWSFVKSEKISLKNHPVLGETWIHDRIAEDPGILGLGALNLCRRGAAEGGLQELVLERAGDSKRYAVLVQNGATDEVQLVRAIESWGRERQSNPATNLSAVLVSEQVGTRFVNLASALGGAVPLAAIEMQAMKVGEQFTVIFTPLAGDFGPVEIGGTGQKMPAAPDTAPRAEAAPEWPSTAATEPAAADAWQTTPEGSEYFGEESFEQAWPQNFAAAPTVDRTYWESRAQASVEMADQLLAVTKVLDPAIELDYRADCIGLVRDGEPVAFARFQPEPSGILLGLNIEQNSLIELSIAQAGLERIEGDGGSTGYSIRLPKSEMEAQRAPVARLLQLAYEESKL